MLSGLARASVELAALRDDARMDSLSNLALAAQSAQFFTRASPRMPRYRSQPKVPCVCDSDLNVLRRVSFGDSGALPSISALRYSTEVTSQPGTANSRLPSAFFCQKYSGRLTA